MNDIQFPGVKGKVGMTKHGSGTNSVYGRYAHIDGVVDSGSAARFFYQAKVPKSERWGILRCGCETVKLNPCERKPAPSPNDLMDIISHPVGTLEDCTTDGSDSSTILSGKPVTDTSQKDTPSTTSMESARITDSKTSNLSPTPTTKESTEGVKSGTVSGGSHAESAANSNPSPLNTSTSQKKAGLFTGVVGSVISAKLFKPNVCEKTRLESHVIQKPLQLIRYLVRLVTPLNGVVLDPFLGSGTTALACHSEGFRCIGVEQDNNILIVDARWKACING